MNEFNSLAEKLNRDAEIIKICERMCNRACDFAMQPSPETREAFESDIESAVSEIKEKDAGAALCDTEIENYVAEVMLKSASEGFNTANKEFGKEHSHQNRERYTLWLERCSNCIIILEHSLRRIYSKKTYDAVYQLLITIQQSMIKSQSYKMHVVMGVPNFRPDTSLSDAAKSQRRAQIEEYGRLKKQWYETIESVLLEKSGEYWSGKNDEKEKLITEAKEIDSKISALNKGIAACEEYRNTIPSKVAADVLGKEIRLLRNKEESLGGLQFLKRKAIENEIESLKKQKAEKEDEFIKESEVSIRQIKEYQNKIIELKDRLEHLRLMGILFD